MTKRVYDAVPPGAPLSIFGGRADIMGVVSPLGASAHSGTYNGHLYAVLPALAAVKLYNEAGFFEELHGKAKRLYDGANEVLATLEDRMGVPARIQGIGP